MWSKKVFISGCIVSFLIFMLGLYVNRYLASAGLLILVMIALTHYIARRKDRHKTIPLSACENVKEKEVSPPVTPLDLDGLAELIDPILDDVEVYNRDAQLLCIQAQDIVHMSRQLSCLRKPWLKQSSTIKIPESKKSPGIPCIDLDEIKDNLAARLDNDRLYLNEALTLASLAHELNVEPYQLSYYLNRHLNTSFNKLINSYRINEAKSRLNNSTDETILDVAFAAGFNSKASFNRIFKKETGMTPSQYKGMVKKR